MSREPIVLAQDFIAMSVHQAKCRAYWAEFIESLPAHDPRRMASPDAFGFGDDDAMADRLAALVVAGKKSATASLPVEYTAVGQPLPKKGDLSIVLDGSAYPVAIIERTSVELVPFDAVSAAFAACEGEADASLGHWRDAHSQYFDRVLSRLGGRLDGQTGVLCQHFRCVWPRR